MFAIIEIGGKQYKIEKGSIIEVEKLDKQEGEEFDIKEVLLLDDNGDTKIGTPYIKEASIKVKVLGEIKGDKVTVFKMKAKKRYERTQGHRQKYTEIEVLEIK